MAGETEANEQNKKGKRSWLFRKITDDWIFGEVLVISAAFIIAYAVNFHGQGLSPKTEDWAYFATYLSGTVGVTAVVATLIVLVRTLGQQQALIDSQNKMLKKQEKQIKISKKQLKSESERRGIELAHNSAVKVFPVLIDRFKSDLNNYLNLSEAEEKVIEEIKKSVQRFDGKIGDFFFRSEELLSILEKHEPEVVLDIVDGVFSFTDKVYFFAASHLKITRDLTEFFYIYMHEDITPVSQCYEYMTCYHAFLMGREEKRYVKLGIKCLGLPSSYNESADYYLGWYKIGKLLKHYER